MKTLQVTLTAGATQISPDATRFQVLTFQNNAAAVCRVGDGLVSASRGVALAASGGTYTLTAPLEYAPFLSEFFLFGTAGQVIDILYVE